jgi:hypothetical protein
METEVPDTYHDQDDSLEHERSWRDPSGHKLRSVVTNWQKGPSSASQIGKVCLIPGSII